VNYTKTKKVDYSGYIGYTGFNAYHAKNKVIKALDAKKIKYVRVDKCDTGSYYIIGATDFDQIRISNHTVKMDWFVLNRLSEKDFVRDVVVEEFDGYGEFDICTKNSLEALLNKLAL